MPVPPNITSATAIAITELPFHYEQRVDFGGVTYSVWFKRLAPIGQLEIGASGAEAGVLDIYGPTLTVYIGDATTPHLNISATDDKPIQMPLAADTTYYFKISPAAGNPSPANLVFDVYAAPQEAIDVSFILVNDDTPGFPGAIVGADGTVKNFAYPMPAGEAGDILPTGEISLYDFNTETLHFFDNQLNLVQTVAVGSGDIHLRTSLGMNRFYVGRQVNPVQVKSYNAIGVEQSSIVLTGITNLIGLAASNDGTLIYWSNNSASSPIRVWDVGGAAEAANLAAGVANRWIPDILVLGDDTIVASSVQISPGVFEVLRYSAAGALLNTYAIGTTLLPAGTFPRLAYSPNDPDSFWVWWHPTPGMSRFQEIAVSDGSVLQTRNVVEFEGGLSESPDIPLGVRFGVSFSCPFIVLRAPIVQSNAETLFVVSEPAGAIIGPLVWVEWPRRVIA